MGEFNPMQVIQAIKSGQNPQQIVMNILQEKMGNTPIGQNLINLVQNNKTDEVEQIVRNMASQRGIDFDKEFTAFKKIIGIK